MRCLCISVCVLLGLLACVSNAVPSPRSGRLSRLYMSRSVPSSFVQVAGALKTKHAVLQEPSNLAVDEIVKDATVFELSPGDIIMKPYKLGADGNPPPLFLDGVMTGSGPILDTAKAPKDTAVTHFLLVTRRIAQVGKGLLFLVEPINPDTGKVIALGRTALPVTTWSNDLKWLFGYRYIGRSKEPEYDSSFIQRTAMAYFDINNDIKLLDKARFFRVLRAEAHGQPITNEDDNVWLQQISKFYDEPLADWRRALANLVRVSVEQAKKTKGAKVVVSGAGPTGLSTALLLTIAGFDIDLYDARCAYTRRHIVDVLFESTMRSAVVSQLNSKNLERDLIYGHFLENLHVPVDGELLKLVNGYGMASVLSTFGFMTAKQLKLKDERKPPVISADVNRMFDQIITKTIEQEPHVISVVISDLEKLLYTAFIILRSAKSTISFSGCSKQQTFSHFLRANAGYAKGTPVGDVGAWPRHTVIAGNSEKLGALYPPQTANTVIVHAEGGGSYFRRAVGTASFLDNYTPRSPPFTPFTANYIQFSNSKSTGVVRTPVDVQVPAAPVIDWSSSTGRRADTLVPTTFKVTGANADKADDVHITKREIAPNYIMVVLDDPGHDLCKQISKNKPTVAANQAINIAISNKLIYVGYFVMTTKPALNKCQIELGIRPAYVNVFKTVFPQGFRWPRAGEESVDYHTRARLLLDIVKGVTGLKDVPIAFTKVLEMKMWESPYGYASLHADANYPAPVAIVEDKSHNTHVLLGDAARDPYTTFAMGVNDGAFSAVLLASSLMAQGPELFTFADKAPMRTALFMKNIHDDIIPRISHADNLKIRAIPAVDENNCAKFVDGLCLKIAGGNPTISRRP